MRKQLASVALVMTATLTMLATMLFPSVASAMPVTGLVLNEWNAVTPSQTLINGDPVLGNGVGNGGDWFELVVVEDNLDVRGWTLEHGSPTSKVTFEFADDAALSNLRAGTIITVAEDFVDDLSFDPASGDWTINLQANRDDEGAFFTTDTQGSFNSNNQNWQLSVQDDTGATLFGPAGEGAGGLDSVGNNEVGELAADPSVTTDENSGYQDSPGSTFGAPNDFAGGPQDFTTLRSWFNPGGGDTVAPSSTFTGPTSAVEPGTVAVTGTTTDNVGVTRVRIAVVDVDTGEFQQADGSFGTTRVFTDAVLDSPGATSTDWTLNTDLSDDGKYRLLIKGRDAAVNDENTVRAVITVRTPIDDSTAPTTTFGDPTGAVAAGPFDIEGNTTDDNSINRVKVAVIDTATGDFLQLDGSFAGPRVFQNANLDNRFGTDSDWALPVDLADGKYRILAKGIDSAGNAEMTKRRTITVRTASSDVTPPESTTTAVKNQPIGAVSFDGTATDNEAVNRVRVSIRSRDDNTLWVQADGSLGTGQAQFDAVLSAPGATSTDWDIDLNLPSAGRYRLIVKAIDANGNVQSPTTGVNLVAS